MLSASRSESRLEGLTLSPRPMLPPLPDDELLAAGVFGDEGELGLFDDSLSFSVAGVVIDSFDDVRVLLL